jgi:hypothetical protein
MFALLLAACATQEPGTLVIAYQSRGEGEIEPCG